MLGSGVNEENMSKQKLAKELHKPITRKLEKQKTHLSFLQYFGCWSCWHGINKEIYCRILFFY